MKKAIMVLTFLMVLALAGYFTASKVWGFPAFGGSAGEKESKKEIVNVSLGQFTTNLKDESRYIRTTVDVAIYKEKGDMFNANLSKSKTETYALLRSKSYEELFGDKGLRDLKEDITLILSDINPDTVDEVFFSEFIVH